MTENERNTPRRWPTNGPTRNVCAQLPEDLHYRFKSHCYRQNLSMKEEVARLISQEIGATTEPEPEPETPETYGIIQKIGELWISFDSLLNLVERDAYADPHGIGDCLRPMVSELGRTAREAGYSS